MIMNGFGPPEAYRCGAADRGSCAEDCVLGIGLRPFL